MMLPIEEIIKNGMDDFTGKPITNAQLIKQVA